ncbi:MAG: family 16 glycoside hydrolase, partial [Chloroflexota bacterium]
IVLALLGTQLASVYCSVVGFFRGGSSPCGGSSTILLQESFDNLSGWNFTAGKGWKLLNGQLTVTTPDGEQRGFTGQTSWTDYTVKVQQANLQQGNGYGIYFRTSDQPTVNGYVFQYDPGYAKFLIRKVVDGNESPPIATAPIPAQFQWTNVTRLVQIDVRGSTFTASIDGTTVLQAQDTQFTSGRVGLRAWDDTHASFDNLTVSK